MNIWLEIAERFEIEKIKGEKCRAYKLNRLYH